MVTVLSHGLVLQCVSNVSGVVAIRKGWLGLTGFLDLGHGDMTAGVAKHLCSVALEIAGCSPRGGL